MIDFQQKRKLRSKIYHPYTLGALGILVLLALHSTWTVYVKKRESESLRVISEAKAQELSLHDAQIKADIERLHTPQGLEAEIRTKFNVAKAQESMVVLVDDTSSSSTSSTQATSVWNKIKKFFHP